MTTPERTPTPKVKGHKELLKQKRADSVRANVKMEYLISDNTAISPQQILFGLARPKIMSLARILHDATHSKYRRN